MTARGAARAGRRAWRRSTSRSRSAWPRRWRRPRSSPTAVCSWARRPGRDRRDPDLGGAGRRGAGLHRPRGRVHGGAALAAVTSLAALTALSILWSLYPSDSWVEANRTLAYVATFAAGLAAVASRAIAGSRCLGDSARGARRLGVRPRDQGRARLAGPGRDLRPPARAVRLLERGRGDGCDGVPLCLWLGARRESRPLEVAVAYPVLGLLIVTMLSASRAAASSPRWSG